MVTALVTAETVLLALLILFVVALLRSHAEILRRLDLIDPQTDLPQPKAAGVTRPAAELAGTTPSGGARQIATGRSSLLLAFLSSGCSSCAQLIDSIREGLSALPAGTRLVVVTKDAEVERARRFRPLEPLVDVVMSSEAWTAYEVPGSPYFVHIESGAVSGEGSATSWLQVGSLLTDVFAERDDQSELPQVDAAFAAAGIGPNHSSLYPARDDA